MHQLLAILPSQRPPFQYYVSFRMVQNLVMAVQKLFLRFTVAGVDNGQLSPIFEIAWNKANVFGFDLLNLVLLLLLSLPFLYLFHLLLLYELPNFFKFKHFFALQEVDLRITSGIFQLVGKRKSDVINRV